MSKQRKVLYFLGAGASLGAGAMATVEAGGEIAIPTQANFWEIFLRFCKDGKRRKRIESFLFRYFLGYKKVPSRFNSSERRRRLNGIDVEEVFTFLSERVRAPSTSPQLRTYAEEIWQDLVSEVGNVFRHFNANKKTRYTYRTFLSNHVRSYDAIVSFNYDTVFEDSLPTAKPWAYEGIEDCTNKLLILKPHGSINWGLTNNIICRSKVPASSVVVAPTHLKFISAPNQEEDAGYIGYLDQSPQIQAIWSALEREMRSSRVLVFIGYSFPVADLYFSSLLRSVIATRDDPLSIVIVNPDAVAIAERLNKRFAIQKLVRYFDMAQFIQASRSGVFSQLQD